MKNIKKIGALVLALVMVLAMSSTAFAAVDIGSGDNTDTKGAAGTGEVGGYHTADTQNISDKTVNLKKEITAFNPETILVYGPEITYTYTLVPAADHTGDSPAGPNELVTITDATTDHTSTLATTVTVRPGITAGVTVNSGTAGTTSSASGTVQWHNTDVLEASSTGVANIKNLPISFENVIFDAPGVYRYKITETVSANSQTGANAYTTAGVINGNITDVRYLDVYVMRSDAFVPLGTEQDDGNGNTVIKNQYVAADWRVYGYVCVDSTLAATNITTGTTKTNGFVDTDGSSSSTVTADEYYTYNLTITKDLFGDSTMENNKFPFDVTFANTAATGTFQLHAINKSATAGDASFTSTTEAATATVNGTSITTAPLKVGAASTLANTTAGLQAGTSAGQPKLADDGKIQFVGIPCGTIATVKETNNVVGTVYATRVYETVGSGTRTQKGFDNASTAVLGAESSIATGIATMDPNDTAVYVMASAPTSSSNNNVTIDYTNTLSIISPTGVAFRVAPYVLMLVAGLFLVLFTRRRKKDEEEYAMA